MRWLPPILFAVAVLLLVFAIIQLVAVFAGSHQKRVDSFNAHCTEAKGHLYSPEIILCVSEDGRIVEVYP